ncbi:hypothetical protein K2173_004604 [Erythroxylum novogranatense]|uniref:Glycine-rich protein n=1 Tax=Erythroxylum novogranatense TaxID=1862640 RepID=A0AAV8S4P8_9ROSI|nr:hypothetical protein K2173_004604 [Erythroxylum novogranatense]
MERKVCLSVYLIALIFYICFSSSEIAFAVEASKTDIFDEDGGKDLESIKVVGKGGVGGSWSPPGRVCYGPPCG